MVDGSSHGSSLRAPGPPPYRRGRRQPAAALLAAALVGALGAAPAAAIHSTPGITQLSRASWHASAGLPDGEIRALLQTRDGYLWVGGYTGLARFDGVRFTVFPAAQHPGLTAIPIEGLAEGADGSLWVASPGGLSRYANGRFTRYGAAEGLRHPYSRSVLPEPDGSILVATGGSGVWRLDLDTGRFRQLPPFDRPGVPQFVEDVRRDLAGRLWAATTEGVLLVEAGRFRLFTTADGLASDRTSAVYVDRSGSVWVGTTGGLSRFDGELFHTLTVRDGLPDDDVVALHEDRRSRLWIGTRAGGLACLSAGRLVALTRPGSPEAGVFSLLEDRQGGLWIGTDEGLDRLNEGPVRPYGRSEGLPSEETLGVLPARDGSVYYVDGRGAVGRLIGSSVESVLPRGAVTGRAPCLEEAQDGIWVAGVSLQRIDRSRPETLPAGVTEPTALRADGDGLLFAARAGDSGFGIFRRDARGITRLYPEVGIATVHVHSLLRDRAGRVWAATEGAGVHRLGKQGHRRFAVQDGLPHDTSYSLFEDERGNVWAGTRRGLARIDGERVRVAPPPVVMPSETLLRFAADRAGHLWLASDGGVIRQSLADLAASLDTGTPAPARLFGVADGLRSVCPSWRPSGVSPSPDGHVWLATARGLAAIHPEEVIDSAMPLGVFVERLVADGQDVTARLELPPGTSRVAVQYTGIEFGRTQDVRFRYQLLGYDPDWVEAGTRRETQYTRLPPGRYTFRVAACGPEQGACEQPAASLAFEQPALWYQTGLFRLAVMAGLTLLVLSGASLRERTLRRREAGLARLVGDRTSELSRQIVEREQVEEALRRLTASLEDRVRSRTEELERTNAQLAEDVAARALAEHALFAEKERLAVTLRSLTDGVVATTTSGRVALINRSAESMTGWPAGEALGQPAQTVMRLLDRATREAVVPVPPHVSPGAAIRDDSLLLLVARDGREIVVAVSAAAIRDRDSQPHGLVLVFRDVTEKLRLEEQLQQRQKLDALGVLAGGIAHDFNNLLSGIFGFIDIARGRTAPGSPALAPLESALSVLDRARGLTGQLLTFARGGEPVTRPTSLAAMLSSCVRFALSGSTARCELRVPDDLWPCEVDERLVDQAIDNVLINARQAMPDGGTVFVSAENVELEHSPAAEVQPGRYVRLTVRDEGAGIPHGILGRVFDPFFTTKPTGTGLGLATTHSVVKKHHGHVAIESEPGTGTTVRMLLPAARQTASELPAQEPAPPQQRGRVLVMDDESFIRDVAREALEGYGYHVEVASCGSEAVALHAAARGRGEAFDCVILDLTVPGDKGGVATLELLRHAEPSVRAIASSGYSTDPVMADPTAYGFRTTVTKPYTIDELARAVQTALRD